MAARKKRKVVKKQSLNEFRAWLEGVEELQDSTWTPSSDQWNKIRTRIDNIEDSAPVTPNPVGGIPHIPAMQPMAQPSQQNAIPGYAPPPQTPSNIPMPPPDVDMSPAAKALLGGSAKTPDSSADDNSPFA